MKSIILFLFVLTIPVIGYSEDSIYKTPEYYLNRIILEKSDVDLIKEMKSDSENWSTFSSWEKFPINKFDSITPNHPNKTYSIIRKKMIEICQVKGFDILSLSKCLDIIKKNGNDNPNHLIILPIAAYIAKFGKNKVWIIRCIWEWKIVLEDIFFSKGISAYGHDRSYAINNNFKIIAVQTCE